MAEFLSDEWIAALDGACRVRWSDPAPEGDAFVIEPAVVGVPGRGEVRYRFAFGAAGCRVGRAPTTGAADVRLETDYGTAVALARGEMNAQAALAAGRLRVSGDVAGLAERASALAALDDVFAAVRGATSYSGAGSAS